jgi:hypothetical protein
MPYVCDDFEDLENAPVVGNGDCVTLIKMKVPGLIGRPTSEWREGRRVIGSTGIARGTAIATFENGRYPNRPSGNHAAIFLAYAGASIWVLDQWKNEKKILIEKRALRIGRRRTDGSLLDPSNASDAFSVIER